MKTLLHICCGPCAVAPVESLRQEGFEVAGFFYNPNIHPYAEYRRRYQAVVAASERLGLGVVYHRYDFEDFLRQVCALPSRAEQHALCWRIRLEETARVARARGFENFTTTLLSSPYQDIETIGRMGEAIGRAVGVTFLVRPFRRVFADSHKKSKEWQLYHQDYCGCIFSEKEAIDARDARAARSEPEKKDSL
jgi:predicted adenine nucleotide alpha hydrolase (AANH) superfamily ATPase